MFLKHLKGFIIKTNGKFSKRKIIVFKLAVISHARYLCTKMAVNIAIWHLCAWFKFDNVTTGNYR